MKGEIGVAESQDGGVTWRYLGIVLRENWHLSYPHVFSWKDHVYMMPEGSGSGSLRLYRAVEYPLKWELVQEMVNKPLIDASIVEWQGRWYLLASDPVRVSFFSTYSFIPSRVSSLYKHLQTRSGYKQNAELQIFHAESPLGPWTRHFLNPVMYGNVRAGARMGGRILKHNDKLYRFGQDCGGTYGRNVNAFRIDVLSPTEFDQTRVKFTARRTSQGPGAWNGVRRHHVDGLQLRDGSWVAVMDGDWQESNPLTRPVVRKAVALGIAWAAAIVIGLLTVADRRYSRAHLALPTSSMNTTSGSCLGSSLGNIGSSGGGASSGNATPARSPSRGGKSGGSPASVFNSLSPRTQHKLKQHLRGVRHTLRWVGNTVRRTSARARTRLSSISRSVFVLIVFTSILISLLVSMGAWAYLSLLRETPSATTAIQIHGTYSRYTVVILSHPSRAHALRSVVDHYSRCPSAGSILVVWNGGVGTAPADLEATAAVPVRVRGEEVASLNNRFKPDPLIKTRAILSLDDDVLLHCIDLEVAFADWRRHPDTLVGFHPRLLAANPGKFWGEKETLEARKFNALLTGTVFMDAERWFAAYWSEEQAGARGAVDERLNCEDVLMNFVVAKYYDAAVNGTASMVAGASVTLSLSPSPLRYIHAHTRLDLSVVALRGRGKKRSFTKVKEECIDEMTRLFGKFPLHEHQIALPATT